MYGTVARMRVKDGRFDELLRLYDEWDRDYKPKVDGAEGGYLYRLDADANTLMLAVVFRDKASYVANADNPEQDEWFRRFRDCLEADPEWNDGEIIRT